MVSWPLAYARGTVPECQTNEIGKTIDWEILDDPHPQACDVRARSRCNLDRSRIRRLRVPAEDKTEYPARRPARVGAKVTGVELHIGLSSTSHSSFRSELNDRQCDDAATRPLIADLDARLLSGARIRPSRAGLQRRRRVGAASAVAEDRQSHVADRDRGERRQPEDGPRTLPRIRQRVGDANQPPGRDSRLF